LIDILPKNDYSNESKQRPCTAVSNHSKPSVHFLKQKQTTSDKKTCNVNVSRIDNSDALSKTITETLLIHSMPLYLTII
jgi:hypothetical protein